MKTQPTVFGPTFDMKYQDRLGTPQGKLKKETRFWQRGVRQRAGVDRERSCETQGLRQAGAEHDGAGGGPGFEGLLRQKQRAEAPQHAGMHMQPRELRRLCLRRSVAERLQRPRRYTVRARHAVAVAAKPIKRYVGGQPLRRLPCPTARHGQEGRRRHVASAGAPSAPAAVVLARG